MAFDKRFAVLLKVYPDAKWSYKKEDLYMPEANCGTGCFRLKEGKCNGGTV